MTNTKMNKTASLLDKLIEHSANDFEQKIAYRFQLGSGKPETMSYTELNAKARSLAAQLKQYNKPGSRALLLFDSQSEFIKCFFGCLYAGIVAVPTYPPHPALIARMLPRILTVIQDSGAEVVLTDRATYAVMHSVRELHIELKNLQWIMTDDLGIQAPLNDLSVSQDLDSLALIQYTSGSTGSPKGVMITHSNLAHQCESICKSYDNDSSHRGVTWTPVYHDMGLIWGMLFPIYFGMPMTVLSPIDFLKKPSRWLKAISDAKATTTSAPNFAYELCTRKITSQEMVDLDLSHLSLAWVGAEPVKAETLEQFAKKFKPCGFNASSFQQAYGMAEATLVITATTKKARPMEVLNLNLDHLDRHLAQEVNSSTERGVRFLGAGYGLNDMEIKIVDPESYIELASGQIGEIWVHGPSVAKGYWQNPKASSEVFRAVVKGGDGTAFLRTGDLGFKKSDGELVVTGRLKDLIIINGRNLYPQDIEQAAEKACPQIRKGCIAAFEVTRNGEAKAVIVAEIDRKNKKSQPSNSMQYMLRRFMSVIPMFDPDRPLDFKGEEAVRQIRQAVAMQTQEEVYAIVFIRAGTISKTSSGKIQRRTCRDAFEKGKLKSLFVWNPANTLERVA